MIYSNSIFDMKRALLIILVYTLLATGAVRVLAADTQSDRQQIDCQSASREKLEYFLPAPGMLSDHPLYFLKQIRDSILEYLITDPVKKVEFDILLADKFLSMSEIQFNSAGKINYVPKILTRSSDYSEKALTDIEQIKLSGKSYPPDLKEKLLKSIGKHIETATIMRCNSQSADLSRVISDDTARQESLYDKAAELK